MDLFRELKKDGIETFLVTSSVNVGYLSGFTGDSSFLAVTPKSTVLISDDRFSEQIKEECPGLEVHIRPHDKTTYQAAVEVLTKLAAKNVGVESNRLTMAEFELLKETGAKLTFVPLNGRIEFLRTVKDPSEVEAIRGAIRVAERAYRMFVSTLAETDTEKEMADALEGYVRRAGAKCTAFPSITAVGERTALPHCPPHPGKRLGDGSKLLIDFGADVGYKSDITRTLRSPFITAPTRRNKHERTGFNLEKIHATILEAQQAALTLIRQGVKAKDVDAAARGVIHKAGYGEYFTHGLGHGLGLEVHEAPRVRANSEDVLEAGMVITIEPGIYIPEWGGVRVEDDVLVTKDGCTVLTSLSRDLSAIM